MVVEQLDVPAAWWCASCGYLLPPCAREITSAPAGDPMRGDYEPPCDDRPCPHCDEHAWVDLGVVGLAMRVRDDESAMRRRAAAVMRRLLAIFVRGDLPLRPYRWHRPSPAWSRGRTLTRGIASGPELLAPLSNRPAIAWLVAVREGGRRPDRRARATTTNDWMLVEQRCAGLSIDGARLSHEPVLDLVPRRRIDVSPDAEAWLRTRGLEPLDLEIFEAILAPGDDVELFADRRGGPPILRSR